METSEKSTFVTVVAWVFIIVFSLVALVALLQNIAYFTIVVPNGGMHRFPATDLSSWAGFLHRHAGPLLVSFFVFALLIVVSSALLLNRKLVGLYGFSGLLALSILANLLYWIGSLFIFRHVGPDPHEVAMAFKMHYATAAVRTLILVIRIIRYVLSVALAAVEVFILVKLNTKKIKGEFH